MKHKKSINELKRNVVVPKEKPDRDGWCTDVVLRKLDETNVWADIEWVQQDETENGLVEQNRRAENERKNGKRGDNMGSREGKGERAIKRQCGWKLNASRP